MQNRSAPPGSVFPVLSYDDVTEAIDWLCHAFGFTERLRAGDSHAQLLAGDGSIMLGRSRIGQSSDSSDHAALRPSDSAIVSSLVHVAVDNVDEHFDRATAFGARILLPPTDYPFGERQYTAEDLAGHRWTFSQSIADIDPRDWGLRCRKPNERGR